MMQPRKARADAGAAPTPAAPPGQATAPDAEVAAERLADWLIRMVATHERDALDPADPAQAPFYEWLAAEARSAQTPEERAQTAREAQAFARVMMQRLRDADDGASAVERQAGDEDDALGDGITDAFGDALADAMPRAAGAPVAHAPPL